MDQTPEIPLLDQKTMTPFLVCGALWVILSGAICYWLSENGDVFHRSLIWMLRLTFLSLMDLLAMAKVFYYVFELQRPETSQKRIFSVIRASYWGAIKIACIVICGTILVKGSHLSAGIPPVGLVTGISTLVVVPLAGGLVWYFTQRSS